MSDAAGLVVLAGRIIFAFFFGFVAGWSVHVKTGSMMEGYARQMNSLLQEGIGLRRRESTGLYRWCCSATSTFASST